MFQKFLIFPGSVPREGLRLASRISPFLNFWIIFNLAKFRINFHALLLASWRLMLSSQ